MDRTRFLKQLEKELYFFNDEEIKEIMDEYILIFDERNAEGKSDIEVLKLLDTPEQIANAYSEELDINISKVDKFFINSRKFLQRYSKEINGKLNNKKELKILEKGEKNFFVKLLTDFYKIAINFVLWLIQIIVNFILWLTQIIVILFQIIVKIVLLSFMLIITIGYLLFVLIFRFDQFNLDLQLLALLIYVSIFYVYIYINRMVGRKNE